MTPKGAQKRKWPFSVIKCTSLEESRYKVQNFFVWILSATKLWRIYWPIYPCKMISGGRRLRSENLAETYPPPSSIAKLPIRLSDPSLDDDTLLIYWIWWRMLRGALLRHLLFISVVMVSVSAIGLVVAIVVKLLVIGNYHVVIVDRIWWTSLHVVLVGIFTTSRVIRCERRVSTIRAYAGQLWWRFHCLTLARWLSARHIVQFDSWSTYSVVFLCCVDSQLSNVDVFICLSDRISRLKVVDYVTGSGDY